MGHQVGASNSDWNREVGPREGSPKEITYELNCKGQGGVSQPAQHNEGRGK